MIWSEQELANMPVGGKNVVVERFMKHLDEPVNASIFKPENFSFLWGILGVAGLKGASEEAREEIWEALKQNGAVDAYDKGILGDFNHRLFETYNDNRLSAWRKLDNYDAGLKFRNVILHELLKTNEKLEKETAPYCIDAIKMVSELDKFALQPRLKAYLEQIRSHVPDADDDVRQAAAYEKEAILRKLCDVLVYAKREFSEDEKEYFYFYLKDALNGGFEAKNIGVDDRVLARLCANENFDELAELDAYPLKARNADILEMAEQLEEHDDFFEQTAAQYILNDKRKIPQLVERCLTLINVSETPRGVFFALQLCNLQQTKSAFKILVELAKKGRATEAACFVHRLLPQAKGAENLLVDLLVMNLKQIRSNPYLGDNAPFGEYVAQIYLQAARSFSEAWHFKEGARLLKELVAGMWLDGVRALYPNFITLANHILAEDKETTADLVEAARMLHLQVFENWNNIFIGEEEDNPLTATRQMIQKKVMDATTFDIGRVLDKMAKAEASTYGAYHNIKEKFKKKSVPEETAQNAASSVTPAVEENIPAEEPKVEFTEENKENINNVLDSKSQPLDEYLEAPVPEDSLPPLDAPVPFQKTPDVPAGEQPISEFKETEVPEIEQWAEPGAKNVTDNAEPGVQNRFKVNIGNILNIKSEDVEKHFEKIKQVTSTAIQRAEEQAKRLKGKVHIDEDGLEQQKKAVKDGVKKILKFFKK